MFVYYLTILLVLLPCVAFAMISANLVAAGELPTLTLKRKTGKKIVVLSVFIILAFVAAFRYKVGTDFHAYYRTSIWSNKFAQGEFVEPGFTILAIITDFIFQGKNGGLTIVCAIITTALFVFTIAKRSEDFTISILLFIFIGCFSGMFNGVRQYLATAIMFSGFQYVQEKKIWKWLLVVLLASSIHITAILMFFIYFACNMKCNWTTILLYFTIAVLLLFFYEPLFNLVGVLKQEDINTDVGYVTHQVNRLRVAVHCVPLLIFIMTNKQKINSDDDCRTLFNVCLLNAAIAIAAMNSAYLSRFYIFTMCFQVLMYPKVFSKFQRKDRPIFTMLMLICYAGFWYYETSTSNSLNNFQWIFSYL